jgi:hypothetical protein
VIDGRSVSAFLRELQRDIARDDRPAVSQRVHYPLTVFAGRVRITKMASTGSKSCGSRPATHDDSPTSSVCDEQRGPTEHWTTTQE